MPNDTAMTQAQLLAELVSLRAEVAELRERAGVAAEANGERVACDRAAPEHEPDDAVRHALRSVHSSEQRLAAALDAIQDCFAILSAVRDGAGRIVDFRFEYINAAGARNNGRPVDQHLGRTVLELLPGHAAGPLLERYAGVVETGEPLHLTDVAHADEYGREGPGTRLFDVRVVRFNDGILVTWRDVTDRSQAESDLRRLIDTIPQFVATAGPDGTIQYLNPRLLAYCGCTLAELRGVMYERCVHPEDLPAVRATWSRALATGEDRVVEQRVRRHDGVYRWFRAHYRPLRNDEGTITQWVGTLTDVDDRKRAEMLLRESEARFRQLADAMPQIVWTTDARGAVEYFNRRWEEVTGLAVERSLGAAWGGVVHPDDRPAAVQRWAHAVATGTPYENEHRYRRHDGTYRWQLVRGVPVRDDAGAVVRWFGTCTDIHAHKVADETARAAREQAEQANRAKDEFLAALSHELRTPLTPVLVTAQMLEDDRSLSEEARHDLRVIRRNVELETRLIDDLLDLTRVSRGKLTLHLDRVDVHAILRDAMKTCSDDVASQKRLAVRLEAGAAHHHVRGDAARLSQIFWNLIKNAVKFTPAGGEIVLRTSNPTAADAIVVSVSDTGVGIDADVLPHVFNAFEQGGAAVTRKFGGLGLGLAICRAVAEMHGGRIEATSAGPGHGATFTLTLPVLAVTPAERVADATRAAAAVGRTPAGSGIAGRGGRRILLVEDHEQTAKALRRLVTNLGFEVEWRSSVSDALDAASRDAFDLVLSDIGLPDGSGLELMRELRARHGLRGIALSGYGMEQDLASSAAAGFLEHLVKPISRDLLGAAIRRHLG